MQNMGLVSKENKQGQFCCLESRLCLVLRGPSQFDYTCFIIYIFRFLMTKKVKKKVDPFKAPKGHSFKLLCL